MHLPCEKDNLQIEDMESFSQCKQVVTYSNKNIIQCTHSLNNILIGYYWHLVLLGFMCLT